MNMFWLGKKCCKQSLQKGYFVVVKESDWGRIIPLCRIIHPLVGCLPDWVHVSKCSGRSVVVLTDKWVNMYVSADMHWVDN